MISTLLYDTNGENSIKLNKKHDHDTSSKYLGFYSTCTHGIWNYTTCM